MEKRFLRSTNLLPNTFHHRAQWCFHHFFSHLMAPKNALYLSFTDGELYTATVSDFSGSDPLIYKEPLRTVQFDSKHLNCKLFINGLHFTVFLMCVFFTAPDFVTSLEDGDYVYFFFREQAVEYINCGKVRIISHFLGNLSAIVHD